MTTSMRLLLVLAISLAPVVAAAQTAAAAPDPAAKSVPFEFADFTWLSGNPRTSVSPLHTDVFTGEVRLDVSYTSSLNHPVDDTIVGSSEVFRAGEVTLTHLGVGGDFHVDHVQARVMTQLGLYATATPRNDASPARGQWQLDQAYRYVSEAYAGYHFDRMHGINLQAGIFMSYIGLWSYYNFDNWTYQPSYVSSNTPWFFTGMRIQFFPTDKLKIEPWVVNGWQSYGRFNNTPGLGGQVLWRPTGWLSMTLNNYWGKDTLQNVDRRRVHTDDSVQVKYFDRPASPVSKAAFTFTFDAGCESGGGVNCSGESNGSSAQYFVGFMAYHRLWFANERFAATVGGGRITNPGRYLVLMPPINGATAASGTPYFSAAPGDRFAASDAQITFDWLPSQFATFRAEFTRRGANVPYFAGSGGVTPPGGNSGAPGSLVQGWSPDLRKQENRFTFALLVKL